MVRLLTWPQRRFHWVDVDALPAHATCTPSRRGPLEVGPGKMGDRQVVNRIIAHMTANHSQPQFVACGLFRPHLPWFIPSTFFDKVPVSAVAVPPSPLRDMDDIPETGQAIAKQGSGAVTRAFQSSEATDPRASAVQGYLASVMFSDANLGMLLDALDGGAPMAMNTGNTILVVWR